MSNKVFVFDKLYVFFKHTDYYGYVHPYNFLEWTSYVREAFFQQAVPNFREVTERPIKMMTVKLNSRILGDAQFGDVIEAKLTAGKIKRVSFDIIIRFVSQRENRVVCETSHTIVFVDTKSAQFANIPNEMKEVIVNYEEPRLPRNRAAVR